MKSKLVTGILWATAAAVIGLVILTRITMPESSESRALREKAELDQMGQTCLDSIKPELKDPFSAQVVSVIRSKGDPDDYAIDYRAKNSFGAYVAGETVCVIRGGKVDELSTNLRRLNIEAKRSADQAHIWVTCLKESNRLLSEGKSEESEKLRCEQYNAD